ncbi:MAG TPA: ABC transporter ATP-binding protein [Thermomicrobiaceae bacterium]|nr:ABC transporter ATP-binding protein [Thermomicrobiaceae bacterium]
MAGNGNGHQNGSGNGRGPGRSNGHRARGALAVTLAQGSEEGQTLSTLWRILRTAPSGLSRTLRLVWETSHRLTAAMAAVTVAQAMLPAAQVWLSKLIIDAVVDGIRTGATPAVIHHIVFLAVLQFAVIAFGSLFSTLANIAQQLLQELVTNRVQLSIIEHADRLDLAFFERSQSYDLLQQAQQEAAYRPVAMVQQSFGLIKTAITFATMVSLIVNLEWFLAVIALLAPIPAFIASTRYGWQGFQLMRRQSPARRMMQYLTTLMTTDSYHKEVKIFTLGGFFAERYRVLFDQYYDDNRRLIVRRYLAGYGWGALTTVASSATYLYVALKAVAGSVTLGDLTLYTQAALSIQNNFQGLLNGLSGMYENQLYLTTLYDLLAAEPRVRPPANPVPVRRPFEQGIEFRDVTHIYEGIGKAALQDVSFTIQPGETVAIVGRNGAGKTTLVKLIARLYDPEQGQVLIDGHDVRDYDPNELRREIGVIFQDYVSYQLTAGENIGLGRLERLEDLPMIELSAGKSGADEVVSRLPEGYDTMLGRWFDSGHQLSGGEWQKIALARAFMRDAQILILDEPTAALDAKAEYELFLQMRELTAGKTAIFISHRFSTVRLADRILVLEQGRLIEQGSHDELMALDGRYAELFNLQAASYR